MKVQFSREVMYYPEWNGNLDLPENERVLVKLHPLKMGDLVSLMDVLQEASIGTVDPQSLTALDGRDVGELKQLVEACGDLIPKYAVVENLEDDTGPVNQDTLVNFPYFMELSAEILAKLAEVSMPTEVEEKNSEPQPDTAPITTQ